jgi:ribosomal-protein-alanine N-acetyltransferase
MEEIASSTNFRLMNPQDLEAVLEIERLSFSLSWGEKHFLAALERNSSMHCVVMEKQLKLLAYFLVEFEGGRTHLMNLAVHPEERRKGHATRCLKVIDQLALKNLDVCTSRKARLEATTPRRSLSSYPPPAWPGEAGSSEESELLEDPASPRDDLVDPDVAEIYLEVEERNLPAQLLYRKAGYRAVQILRNFYPQLSEDAYRMVRRLHRLGQDVRVEGP